MKEEKSWQGRERRSFRRVNLTVKVEIIGGSEGDGETPSQGFYFTRDISSAGLFLLCNPLLPLNAKIDLSLAIPGIRQLIPLKGKIVRHVKTGESGVGVEFFDTPSEFQLLLEEAIEKLATN